MSVQQFDTLTEFYRSVGVDIEDNTECTVHAIARLHQAYPVVSPIFRANYYSLVLVKYGQGVYKLDHNQYHIRAGTIYYTNPGHLKGFELHEPTEAWLITFSEKFLVTYCASLSLSEVSFLLAEHVPPWYPDESNFGPLYQMADILAQHYEGQGPSKWSIMGSLLQALLLNIKDLRYADYDAREEGRQSSAIVREFKRTLLAYFERLHSGDERRLPQVQVLARELSLHPNYLSSVIREKTGKAVNAWIAEHAVAEAKTQLCRIEVSVEDVALTLGFSDAGHFSKYFKKHAGVTPTQFRKQSR